MTPLQLRLKKLRENTTPGEYKAYERSHDEMEIRTQHGGIMFRSTSYGFMREDAKLIASAPALLTLAENLLEALEFYAKGQHFSYDGHDDWEPENPSGEPGNWLCGGAEGSEFTYENGSIASEALAKAEQLFIEKEKEG